MQFSFLQEQYNKTKHKKRNLISWKKTRISEAGKELLLYILTRSFQRQRKESSRMIPDEAAKEGLTWGCYWAQGQGDPIPSQCLI